ncbi:MULTISPECIES: TonB-dependent receptor [unclassified Pseudomonas]|uniref:TonB-dependent receptor n=1 Tax=unclassified Pseudomonas TaxID=196821 RepID=UPI00244800DE|nr:MULTISPECIES: TonB-dependent receptor [unclassified Pseudomonas]MDG9928314.1 TonB-dependent receptor [Pseudomonas sp. GD04042]MDH0481122.1 TonB-dependent receptor [Pseudomonas sp. GD04015]MDH0604458.1 TonB-dependent receptor [Pseudomonas sp. GD03869]
MHSNRSTRQFTRSPLAAAVLLTTLGQAAWAEQVARDGAEQATALGTVTVTATRREASLQEVPVAVSVVDGEQLERGNRNNVAAIVQEVPTLNYRAGASNKDTSLFIRGVGTISTSPGVEPTVATVVDGVVFGRPGQSTLDLLDLQRIEVLRGPQGTLFGKNASAGVLNVVSKDAPEETGGYIDYSHFGGGNENRLRFGLGGRLNDSLKGSLSTLWGSYDGNVENVHNGHDVNGYERKGVRGKLQFEPSEDFSFTLIGDYMDGEDSLPSGVITSANAAFAGVLRPVSVSGHNREINADFKTRVEDSNTGLSGQADWQLGDFTLTSITAWRGWDNTQYQDGDRSAQLPLTASHDKGEVDFDQYSQEFRLTSPKGGFNEYVLGAYYFHGRSDEAYQRWSTNGGVLNHGRADYRVTNESVALFGENTFNFTDDFRALLGLRWTHDDLEYDHRRVSTSATPVTGIQPSTRSEGSVDEDGFSGRTGLQYDFTDNLTGYVTYSRGYKGPAYNTFFNMQPRDTGALKPETSDSYELGLKSTAWNNRLTANLAVFHTDYDDYQANFFDTVANQVVTRLINAGSVKTRGVELDASLQATRQLKLSAALAYTQARVDHFNCPPGAAATCDIDGGRLPFTPDWKSYARADYSIPLDNGLDVELSTDYSWQDEVQFSLDQNPDTVQGAYGIWNASVALADYNAGWRVALLGKNLADKSYAQALASGGSYIYRAVPRDDQRYFGVQLRKDF